MKIELKPLTKVWLFLSSYIPLWVLLLIATFDGFESFTTQFLLALIVLSFLSLYFFLNWAKNRVKVYTRDGEKRICSKILLIIEYEDMSNSYLGYLVTYVLSLFAFVPERTTARSISMFLFIMISIFLLYDKAGLIYTNPMLGLWGYKIFKVKDKKSGKWVILITKNESLPLFESNKDRGLCASHLWGNVYLEVGKYGGKRQ